MAGIGYGSGDHQRGWKYRPRALASAWGSERPQDEVIHDLRPER